MTNVSSTLPVLQQGLRIGMVLLVCAHLSPVAAQERSDTLQRFEVARQACLDGTSGQVFEACMKEARAVQAQPPGSVATVSPEQLRRNSLMRCEVLTGDDRLDCQARMRGDGTASGSVSGGGVLHELVTPQAEPSPPQPK